MTHSILFVGAIDARPELDFVAYLRWQQCTAYITSYGDAPSSLSELAEQTVDGAKILVRGSVDATKLLGTFPEQRFDAVERARNIVASCSWKADCRPNTAQPRRR